MANNSGFTGNTNPQTTDWEEHGAAGDISVGRRLKYTQDVPLKLRVDEGVTYTYIGTAAPGVATSSPLWRVLRILNSTGDIDFADGDDFFNNVWDDRASLSYS